MADFQPAPSGGVVESDGLYRLSVDDTRVISYQLNATTDVNKVFTTDAVGEGQDCEFILPSAVAGLIYHFSTLNSPDSNLYISSAAGDTIRVLSDVTLAGGQIFVSNSDWAASITLVAINATEWVAISVGGSWGVAPP